MCIYKFYIHVPCGHSIFIWPPLRNCSTSKTCVPTVHLFQTCKLDLPCLACLKDRTVALSDAETHITPINYPENKIRVTYAGRAGTPACGRDGIGSRALTREDVERKWWGGEGGEEKREGEAVEGDRGG